jgi:hypothetical protein
MRKLTQSVSYIFISLVILFLSSISTASAAQMCNKSSVLGAYRFQTQVSTGNIVFKNGTYTLTTIKMTDEGRLTSGKVTSGKYVVTKSCVLRLTPSSDNFSKSKKDDDSNVKNLFVLLGNLVEGPKFYFANGGTFKNGSIVRIIQKSPFVSATNID